jgi:hypothetical protein
MRVVCANEPWPTEFTKSIFLAGPSPRGEGNSWRPDAIRELRAAGYDGVIFSPEPSDRNYPADYDQQISWELEAMNRSDCILFWIPRELEKMPGFTTNVEFGDMLKSGKVVLGAPEGAPKIRYLVDRAEREFVVDTTTLQQTVGAAMQHVGEGAFRQGGECCVPIHIWKTPSFQSWLQAHKGVGNRLDGAKQEWVFRVGPNKQFVFAWVLHVNIYVAAEGRNKVNEFIFSRTDVSSIMLYYRPETTYEDIKIAMVKEFRSPVANADCFVRELAGGSSFKGNQDPLMVAAFEVKEEMGFEIEPTRFKKIASRQLAATLSTHKAHLFAAELTEQEIEWLEKQARSNNYNGIEADSERTYVEVRRLGDIISDELVDFANLGMIFNAIFD